MWAARPQLPSPPLHLAQAFGDAVRLDLGGEGGGGGQVSERGGAVLLMVMGGAACALARVRIAVS